MLVACLLMFVLYEVGQCQIILPTRQLKNDHQLIECVAGVLEKYFSERREITYVNMEADDEELLKTIHSAQNFSLISRNPTHQSLNSPNQGYLITSKNVTIFTKYFKYLLTDPTWNPYARFLIIIKSLRNDELRGIFDVLLKAHTINVLVVNGTIDAHLFTYNPFDNYACGKYYTEVISLGLCSQATYNLYPYKLVTGLKNCTFRASLAHRPPFAIHPVRPNGEINTLQGSEEYILKVLSEKEQFNVISYYNYNADVYSPVTPNMTVLGPMVMLPNNETDIIYGGSMMVYVRAQAFTYLSGYHDYNDELRFAVKRASLVPIWKTMYIEFDSTVWLLLLLSFIVYLIMMIYLLQAKDKSYIAMELLDNLLSHCSDIRCRMTLKYIFIMWVWFAYLMNTAYQSSLFSLTTHPSKEYQVKNEEDLVKYKYSPCFSLALRKLLVAEARANAFKAPKFVDTEREGCHTGFEAIVTVSKTKNLYSITPSSYLYYKKSYSDHWGDSLIYFFEKTYTKYLYGYFFYKGFPITPRLKLNALRMRENGLADKSLKDIYFARSLKQKYSEKEFEVRFILPWRLYIVGCIISIVTFLIEYFLPRHHLVQ